MKRYDITVTKACQDGLAFHASRDFLTGLANATLLRDRLRQSTTLDFRFRHWVNRTLSKASTPCYG
ncbi:MAG TPA: hypothetical protein VJ577_20515 [Burkholderiaceae bacterium]|nr:hypothetical protein [Burkholderiaceae bacterium]